MKTLYIATHNKHKEEEIRDLFSCEPALSERFRIESLRALDFHEDIPETGGSLGENALQKAEFVSRRFGVDCFADDTGLEVEAIGMRPGIFSARYANLPAGFETSGLVTPESLALPDPTFDENIDRLLACLERLEKGDIEAVEGGETGGGVKAGRDGVVKAGGLGAAAGAGTLTPRLSRRARFRSVICLILDGQTHYFEGCVNGEILRERHGRGGFGYDPIFRPDGFDRSFAELSLTEKNTVSHRGRAIASLMDFLKNR